MLCDAGSKIIIQIILYSYKYHGYGIFFGMYFANKVNGFIVILRCLTSFLGRLKSQKGKLLSIKAIN